jgi:hypothetical protein
VGQKIKILCKQILPFKLQIERKSAKILPITVNVQIPDTFENRTNLCRFSNALLASYFWFGF